MKSGQRVSTPSRDAANLRFFDRAFILSLAVWLVVQAARYIFEARVFWLSLSAAGLLFAAAIGRLIYFVRVRHDSEDASK